MRNGNRRTRFELENLSYNEAKSILTRHSGDGTLEAIQDVRRAREVVAAEDARMAAGSGRFAESNDPVFITLD